MSVTNHGDRDSFGHWLSGFVDGEGCFRLTTRQNRTASAYHPKALFIVTLRLDDIAILEAIRQFMECGTLTLKRPSTRARQNMPQGNYTVEKIGDLIDKVVPHFERYPLRAKKARDFAIWKEAVAICAQVASRPRVYCLGRQGPIPKWSQDERMRFHELDLSLKSVRVYATPESASRLFPPKG